MLRVEPHECEFADLDNDGVQSIILRSVVDQLRVLPSLFTRTWRAGLYHVEAEVHTVAHGSRYFLSEAFYMCTILVSKSALVPYVRERAFGLLAATSPLAPMEATLTHIQRMICVHRNLGRSYLANVDWAHVASTIYQCAPRVPPSRRCGTHPSPVISHDSESNDSVEHPEDDDLDVDEV